MKIADIVDKPLLVGYAFTDPRNGHYHIKVWCPHCRRWHEHSWKRENEYDDVEHREAHCGHATSFDVGGYYIALAPGVTMEPKPEPDRAQRLVALLEDEIAAHTFDACVAGPRLDEATWELIRAAWVGIIRSELEDAGTP